MAAGINPYAGFQQRQRMGAFAGGMGAYAGGAGGSYGRYRPDTEAAVTGPVGSSSGDNPAAREAGREQMLQTQGQEQQSTAQLGAFRQAQNNQFAANQAKSIEAYRTARDNSQGAQDSRELRQEATSLGIDPSSSSRDVADAMNGGMGTTPVSLDPTQPTPATPGVVQNTPESIRNAVVTRQAAKDGQQNTAQANAYAGGANPQGQPATGADPFTAGIAPRATPSMGLRPAPGMTATGAPPPSVTSPVASTSVPSQPRPQTPGTVSAPLQPPVPMMSLPHPSMSTPLATAGTSPFPARKPKQVRVGMNTINQNF